MSAAATTKSRRITVNGTNAQATGKMTGSARTNALRNMHVEKQKTMFAQEIQVKSEGEGGGESGGVA